MGYINFLKKLIPNNIIFFLKKRSILRKKFFGLNNLDEKILKYLNYQNGYFVELGANDGISQSNTLHFELYKNWNGILIEPIKLKFNQCKLIRSKNNKYYNCACVSEKFNKETVEIIYSNLRTVTNDYKNLINPKHHINKEDLNIYENHDNRSVSARTLNSILKDANAPKLIDFLSLDTEGYENEVLGGIDYNEFKFKYIMVETKDFEKTNEILTSKNYELVEKFTYHDYFFKYYDNKLY